MWTEAWPTLSDTQPAITQAIVTVLLLFNTTLPEPRRQKPGAATCTCIAR